MGQARRCLFASYVCFNLADNTVSCADITASFILWVKARTPGYLEDPGVSQIIACGVLPNPMKKGESRVDSDRTRLIANSIPGSFVTQSHWLGATQALSIWVIVQLARSVAPSISGW